MNAMELAMAIDWDVLCLRWILTLAHFLWQGVVIGSALGVALVCLRQTDSRLRYWVCAIAQVSLSVVVVATFASVSIESPDENRSVVAVGHVAESPAVDGQRKLPTTSALPGNISPTPLPPGKRGSWNEGGTPIANTPVDAQPVPLPSDGPTFAPSATPSEGKQGSPFQIAYWITGFYVFYIIANLLRLGIGLWDGQRLRQSAEVITDAKWLAMLAQQTQLIGLKNAPLAAYCKRVATPTVIGIVRPIVLWPTALMTGLEREQLAAILRHELAHIRRHDLVVNLLQRIIESLLFFHPIVWWISRQVNLERENCCDDLAARSDGKIKYAGALLRMAELCAGNRCKQPESLPAMSAAGERSSQIGFRVRRMLGAKNSPRVEMSLRSLVLLVVIVAFSCVSLVALGQSEPAPDEPTKTDNPMDSPKESAPSKKPPVSSLFTPEARWQVQLDKKQVANEMFRISPVIVTRREVLTATQSFEVANGLQVIERNPKKRFGRSETMHPVCRKKSSDGRFFVELVEKDLGGAWGYPTSLLRVFRVSDGQQVGATITLSPSILSATKVDVERGGNFVLVGDRKNVRVYRMETGKVETTLPVKTKRIDALAFSPDLEWLVVSDRNDLHFWKWRDQAPVKTIHAGRKIDCLKFTPDGQYLAEGPDSRQDIQLRDMRTLNTVASLEDEVGSPLMVSSMDITPDGRYLAAQNEVSVDPTKLKIPHRIHVWDLSTQKIVFQVATGEWVRSVAFTEDGRQIIGEFLGAAKGALLAAWDLPNQLQVPPKADADRAQSGLRLGDGIQWSLWGDKDGLLSGARLVLPKNGFKPGDPLTIEYRLANVSNETKTIRLKPHRGPSFPSVGSGRRLSYSLSGSAPAKAITIKPGETYIDTENRVSIDTTGLQPGEYNISVGTAFFYPDEIDKSVTHGIPHRGNIPFTLAGKTKRKLRPLPENDIHWGKPVGALQLGAKWDAEQTAFAVGATLEAKLYVANVSDQPVECAVELPHPADGWLFNVQDQSGSTILLDRGPMISIISIPRYLALKLAPGEIAPITGKGLKVSMSRFPTKDDISETSMPQPRFQVVANKKSQRNSWPDYSSPRPRLISRGGMYSAIFSITVICPETPKLRLSTDSGMVPFLVIGPDWKGNADVEITPNAVKTAATANSLPKHALLTTKHRSSISFHRDGKPLLLLYSRDILKSGLSLTSHDDPMGWTITGNVHLLRDGKRLRQFNLRWTSTKPETAYLNDKPFLLQTPKGKLTGGFGTIVLSEEKPRPIARWLHPASEAKLDDVGRQIDFDVHKAKWYKESRALQAESGAIVEWDTQHPIQHSDHELVSRLRIFPKGRVVVIHDRIRREGLLSPKELEALLDFLKAPTTARGPEPESISVKIAGKEQPVLKLNTWDSSHEIVRFAEGGKMTRIVCSIGPKEPGDGKWFQPIRERLNGIIAQVVKQNPNGRKE